MCNIIDHQRNANENYEIPLNDSKRKSQTIASVGTLLLCKKVCLLWKPASHKTWNSHMSQHFLS